MSIAYEKPHKRDFKRNRYGTRKPVPQVEEVKESSSTISESKVEIVDAVFHQKEDPLSVTVTVTNPEKVTQKQEVAVKEEVVTKEEVKDPEVVKEEKLSKMRNARNKGNVFLGDGSKPISSPLRQ
jgi:hypothetical protein